ncbi:MAG: hypothetical protein QOE65_1787 [Solirubrobacteraceae bacterium]|jgi:hypothetical protein|nr:hypothetical protein [Solirubrobacteraceae bacterium]
MKRFSVLTALVLGAAMLAIPSSAFATYDCGYAATQQVNTAGVTGPALVVYADADGGGGRTGTADVAAGACVDRNTGAAEPQGGTAEVGAGSPLGAHAGQAYAVVDGDNDNVDPGSTTPGNSSGDGYVGVSNFETATRNGTCPPDQPGPPPPPPHSGSNSGGCVGFDPGVPVVGGTYVPVPLVACGNSSGNDWTTTARDGCSLP